MQRPNINLNSGAFRWEVSCWCNQYHIFYSHVGHPFLPSATSKDGQLLDRVSPPASVSRFSIFLEGWISLMRFPFFGIRSEGSFIQTWSAFSSDRLCMSRGICALLLAKPPSDRLVLIHLGSKFQDFKYLPWMWCDLTYGFIGVDRWGGSQMHC